MPIPVDVTKLSLLLDFDGCTTEKEAQKRLIARVIALLKESSHITELEVSIGSTRGLSFESDFHAAQYHWVNSRIPHKSCIILKRDFMFLLEAELKNEALLGVEINFDSMVMGDVLNDLEAGETVRVIQNYHQEYSLWSANPRGVLGLNSGSEIYSIIGKTLSGENITHIDISLKAGASARDTIQYSSGSHSCNDELKILMIYMQMHHKASMSPNTRFVLDFYDDRSDILTEILFFYTNNLQLIPKNCCLRINQFCVEAHPLSSGEINKSSIIGNGSGKINHSFREDVCAIAALHSSQLSEMLETKGKRDDEYRTFDRRFMRNLIMRAHAMRCPSQEATPLNSHSFYSASQVRAREDGFESAIKKLKSMR